MQKIGFKLTAIMSCVILLGILLTLGFAMMFSGGSISSESLEKVRMSTQYEAERLNGWLSDQMTSISSVVDVLSSMDDLADILLANQAYTAMSLEDQTVDRLRPYLKSVLDNNDAFFELYMGFQDGSAVVGSGYQFDYSWWSAPARDWYKLALSDPTLPHVTTPYVDAQTNELCISVVKAVLNKGRLIGVVGADVFVTELQNITLGATLDSKGFSMLIDKGGRILVHPDKEYGPDVKGDFNNIATIMNNKYADMWKKVSSTRGVYPYPDASGVRNYYTGSLLSATGWFLVAALPAKVVLKPIIDIVILVIIVAFIILLFAALIIYLTINKLIAKPITPMTAFFNRVDETGDMSFSQADLSVINNYSKQKDEIGQLIGSASAFIVRINEVSKSMKAVADGDLTKGIKQLSENDEMGVTLKTMTDNLSRMFSNINASAERVSAGSRQVADGAQSLAQGATQQAASIEELSSSIAEIAERTKENAGMAENTARLSDTIRGDAEKGSQQMSEMILAVKEINDASHSIGNIIKTIDDIAFQTNILALNAAVEAARAGEHGKGFAVVAEEVRNLASKSAEAAKDTGDMIQNSMAKAELGSRIAGETAASLTKIASGIDESTQLIKRIAEASEEQSVDITQLNFGIDQMAQVVQQNSATAEESAAASEEMSEQSILLQELISRFRLKDDGSAKKLPAAARLRKNNPALLGKPLLM